MSHYPQHQIIAREALKVYNRDPFIITIKLTSAVQPTQSEHRIFLARLLNRLLLDRKDTFVLKLLEQKAETIRAILNACGSGELAYYWAVLYSMLGDSEKTAEIERMALKKVPETPLDWYAHFKLIEQKGTKAQIASLIDATDAWLAANPLDSFVRTAFLGFVERKGTPHQCEMLIASTASWLTANPENIEVRNALLGLVERKGNPEQIATLIDILTER